MGPRTTLDGGDHGEHQHPIHTKPGEDTAEDLPHGKIKEVGGDHEDPQKDKDDKPGNTEIPHHFLETISQGFPALFDGPPSGRLLSMMCGLSCHEKSKVLVARIGGENPLQPAFVDDGDAVRNGSKLRQLRRGQ